MRFRSGLLAVVLPCLALALAPGAASAQQDNAGSCIEVGSQGTKHDYRCRMGPVTVAPFQVLTKELVFSVPKPDVDGFVTSMNVDVVDANGKRVPINRLMLHHIVFLNLNREDETCKDRQFKMWDNRPAAIGYTPPDKPLPVTRMSGSTPCLVMPHSSPVRIRPVCTSSAMYNAPYRSQSALTCAR